jgi:hypothetical protein
LRPERCEAGGDEVYACRTIGIWFFKGAGFDPSSLAALLSNTYAVDLDHEQLRAVVLHLRVSP